MSFRGAISLSRVRQSCFKEMLSSRSTRLLSLARQETRSVNGYGNSPLLCLEQPDIQRTGGRVMLSSKSIIFVPSSGRSLVAPTSRPSVCTQLLSPGVAHREDLCMSPKVEQLKDEVRIHPR